MLLFVLQAQIVIHCHIRLLMYHYVFISLIEDAIFADRSVGEGRRSVVEDSRTWLHDQFVENYDGLLKRLTRYLGSAEFAYEALHEAYLRLDGLGDADYVISPTAYILRAAINVAKDWRKAGKYRLSAPEISAIMNVCDDAPDPARIVEARSQVEALKRAFVALPPRPREVIYGVLIDEMTLAKVAARLRVSVRTVENDLKFALNHCASYLDHRLVKRFGGRRPRM